MKSSVVILFVMILISAVTVLDDPAWGAQDPDSSFSEAAWTLRFKQARIPLKMQSLKDVRLSDMNGDGYADLIILQSKEKAVVVFLGPGYTKKYSRTYANVGERIIGIADFNGNGRPDVVTENKNKDLQVAIFPGNASGGLDTARVIHKLSVEQKMEHEAIADMNADGKPDIIGLKGGKEIIVLLNKGDFKFTSVRTTVDNAYGGVLPADYDKDGIMDIACQTGEYKLGIVFFKGSGDGSFQLPKVTTTEYWYDGDYKASGDMDGDGKIDIVGCEDNGIWMIKPGIWMMKNLGSGKFGSPKKVAEVTSSWPSFKGIRIADMNGDRRLDVVALSREGVWIATSKGAGRFNPCVSFGQSIEFEEGIFDVADLNKDKKPDIAACLDSNVHLLSFLNGTAPASLKISNLAMTNFVYLDGFYKGAKCSGHVSFSGSGIDLRYTGSGGFSQNAYLYIYVKFVYSGWPYTVYGRGYATGSFINFPGKTSGTITFTDVYVYNGVLSLTSLYPPTMTLLSVMVVDYNLVSSNSLH
jgi:hypothetical protein